ncbi:MAG: hypothetical protein ACKVJU_13690 [Verrucomicrobiales bacterium]
MSGMRMLLPVGRSGWAIAAGYCGLFAFIGIGASCGRSETTRRSAGFDFATPWALPPSNELNISSVSYTASTIC